MQELEEEKAKHAHDTAQGDDVTYALEKERTRLRQELETERQAKKKVRRRPPLSVSPDVRDDVCYRRWCR